LPPDDKWREDGLLPTVVRAPSLRGYRELVIDLGGNPVRLLRQAGIKPSALDQLEAFITFESLITLLEHSAADLDCADFGLRLAERQDIGILGTLAVAMRHSATVGEAAQCASRYLSVHNPAVAFKVGPGTEASQTVLSFDILLEHPPQWSQAAEHGIGLAWRILRLLSEAHSPLRQVRFPHARIGPRASYRRRFGAELIFQAPQAALVVDSVVLQLPISEHNDQLHDLATSYLESRLPARRRSFQLQVRGAIETLLGSGSCSYRRVAQTLFVHPRTLQRRLADEGTTFEAIKDEVRRDLAQRYLAQPEVPLTQVAALLDYSEQSAFTRSCQRWFSTTPSALRTRLIAAKSGSRSATGAA
jgi:AraC-like DNA-binding protein